jgi:hypothetical protein
MSQFLPQANVTPQSGMPVDNFAGASTVLNITATTVIKASAGRLVRINVIVAGAAGSANDCTTTGAVAAANEVAVIPAVVGPVWLDWPCNNGIVVAPGAGQTIAVAFY